MTKEAEVKIVALPDELNHSKCPECDNGVVFVKVGTAFMVLVTDDIIAVNIGEDVLNRFGILMEFYCPTCKTIGIKIISLAELIRESISDKFPKALKENKVRTLDIKSSTKGGEAVKSVSEATIDSDSEVN